MVPLYFLQLLVLHASSVSYESLFDQQNLQKQGNMGTLCRVPCQHLHGIDVSANNVVQMGELASYGRVHAPDAAGGGPTSIALGQRASS